MGIVIYANNIIIVLMKAGVSLPESGACVLLFSTVLYLSEYSAYYTCIVYRPLVAISMYSYAVKNGFSPVVYLTFHLSHF